MVVNVGITIASCTFTLSKLNILYAKLMTLFNLLCKSWSAVQFKQVNCQCKLSERTTCGNVCGSDVTQYWAEHFVWFYLPWWCVTGNGSVSRAEWIESFTSQFGATSDQAMAAFRNLDSSGSGQMSMDHMKRLFNTMDTDGNSFHWR